MKWSIAKSSDSLLPQNTMDSDRHRVSSDDSIITDKFGITTLLTVVGVEKSEFFAKIKVESRFSCLNSFVFMIRISPVSLGLAQWVSSWRSSRRSPLIRKNYHFSDAYSCLVNDSHIKPKLKHFMPRLIFTLGPPSN